MFNNIIDFFVICYEEGSKPLIMEIIRNQSANTWQAEQNDHLLNSSIEITETDFCRTHSVMQFKFNLKLHQTFLVLDTCRHIKYIIIQNTLVSTTATQGSNLKMLYN